MNRHPLLYLLASVLVFTLLGSVKAQTTIPEFEWHQITSRVDSGVFSVVAWSPDSHYIATGNTSSDEGSLLIFDVEQQSLEATVDLAVQGRYLFIKAIDWSQDGKYIAVTADSTLVIVDVATSSILQSHSDLSVGGFPRLKWIEGSRKVALLDNLGFIYIYDVPENRVVKSIEIGPDNWAGETDVYNSFDWDEKRNWFAVPLLGSSSIAFWDGEGNLISDLVRSNPDNYNWLESKCLTSDLPVEFLGVNSDLHRLLWSNNGNHLAIAFSESLRLCTFTSDGTSVQSRRLPYVPNPDYNPNQVYSSPIRDYSSAIAWSNDDRWLFGSLLGCGMGVYNANEDFALVGVIAESICGMSDMSWSPDGKRLAIRNEGLWIGRWTH